MFAIGKRIFLFLLTNLLIIATLSILLNLICAALGINPNQYYSYMLIYSVLFGFGGAFISLFMSKWMAKRMMGLQIIDPRTNDPMLRDLVLRVHSLAQAARLPKMPEVAIYDSPDVNAFATGPSKRNSLVAVSTGLLRKMNREEVEGVLAHEVAHIANGDMVTMTLVQGVINSLVIFLARIIANLVVSQLRSNDDQPNPFLYMGIVFVLEIVLSLFGMIVVTYFSRAREFRADSGGARLAGKDKMIAALRSLQTAIARPNPDEEAIATLKISGRRKGTLAALFSTHPSLDDRIRRLETSR